MAQATPSQWLSHGVREPALSDHCTETDEMFQNAGEKRRETRKIQLDPPRRRANKQRGHGTYANDRPPIVGTVGRHSGQVPVAGASTIRMARRCKSHVHGYTRDETPLVTPMNGQGYNRIKRPHHTVCHGQKEGARDDDGDGIREVHTNTIEGLWTSARNFLRPFRGVHKKYLQITTSLCVNIRSTVKRISPQVYCSTCARSTRSVYMRTFLTLLHGPNPRKCQRHSAVNQPPNT